MGDVFRIIPDFKILDLLCTYINYRQVWHFRILKPRFQDFYVPGSDSGDILFLPCLFVGLFVGWTTLTLVITFEMFEIEPLYLACRFLVTRASHSYKMF